MTAAGAKGRHDETRITTAIDEERCSGQPLHRSQIAGAERRGGAGRRPRHERKAGAGRERPYRLGLAEIVDDDLDLGQAAASASAATPGSSLPSSHSRKAPPAVET